LAGATFTVVTATFSYPPKPSRGNKVAVVSPAGRAAARFAEPFDLGLARLQEEFDLLPVEYPTTRAAEASPASRAADLHNAFADPEIKAVITSIGGEDELKVLSHLDPDVFVANPKPFFGYSDNTNLHLYLWTLGLVSYHGCAVMVQLARPGALHGVTRRSLEQALFTHGICELEPVREFTDEEGSWHDADWSAREPLMLPADPWSWHGPAVTVSGPAWGGSLEVVDFHLRTGRYLLANERYQGAILFLETSEELPSASYVYRVLMCMGERGLLQQFAAIVWGRPKASSPMHRNPPDEKARYIEEQREAVLAAVREYHPDVPLVFGVDVGHTDPQYVFPSGGQVAIDAERRRLEVTY
jgi:muramoyltetrapeptide carboxypeptidase LdcA involved in peptidoglycan recycling